MKKQNSATDAPIESYNSEFIDIIGQLTPEKIPTYTAPQEIGLFPVSLDKSQVAEILKRHIVRRKLPFHQQGALFANIARCSVGIRTHELENWGVASNNYHNYTLAINEKLADAGINYRIRCMAPKAKVNGKTPSHMMWLVRKASAAECEAWGVSSDVIRDRDLWWDSFRTIRSAEAA